MESKKTRQKTGGRKPGSLNKATASIKEIAGQYTESALETLVVVMQDDTAPHSARISAAREVLDRAHGKPAQFVEIDANVNTHKIDLAAIDAELEKAAEERARRQRELESSGAIYQFQT